MVSGNIGISSGTSGVLGSHFDSAEFDSGGTVGDDLPAGKSVDRRTFLYGGIPGADYQKAGLRPGRMK